MSVTIPDATIPRAPFRLKAIDKQMRLDGIDERRRQVVLELADRFRRWPEPTVGVEVGVYNGKLAEAMLRYVPCLARLVLVDPWREFPADHPDRQAHAYARKTQEQWDEIMDGAIGRIHPHSGRWTVIRNTSLSAAGLLATSRLRFHFVYIDADHTYSAVRLDLEAWWRRVLPGGVLCGDDYRGRGDRLGHWGVGEAVDQFAEGRRLPLKLIGRNWFLAKR